MEFVARCCCFPLKAKSCGQRKGRGRFCLSSRAETGPVCQPSQLRPWIPYFSTRQEKTTASPGRPPIHASIFLRFQGDKPDKGNGGNRTKRPKPFHGFFLSQEFVCRHYDRAAADKQHPGKPCFRFLVFAPGEKIQGYKRNQHNRCEGVHICIQPILSVRKYRAVNGMAGSGREPYFRQIERVCTGPVCQPSQLRPPNYSHFGSSLIEPSPNSCVNSLESKLYAVSIVL